MSDPRLGGQPWSSAIVYAPRLPAIALAGVRSRRIMAVVLDLIIVSLLSFCLWLGLGFLSLGLLQSKAAWANTGVLIAILAVVLGGTSLHANAKRNSKRRRQIKAEQELMKE